MVDREGIEPPAAEGVSFTATWAHLCPADPKFFNHKNWWYRPELNGGHHALQTCVLPTELQHHGTNFKVTEAIVHL